MLKATVEPKELQRGLTAARVIGPLLDKQSLFLRGEKDSLRLLMSGPSTRVEISMPATGTKDGSVAIPQTLIAKLSTSFKLPVVFSEAKVSLGVKTGSSKFRFPKVDVNPALPVSSKDLSGPFVFPTALLREGFNSVVFAAAKTFDRPSKMIQTGIVIRSDGKELSFEAHRDTFMAIHTETAPGPQVFEAVLPAQVAALLQKEQGPECSLWLSDKHARIRTETVTLDTCLLSDHVVDLKGVVSRFGGVGTWTIEADKRKRVTDSISQAMVFQDRRFTRVCLDLNPRAVLVYAHDRALGSGKTTFEDTKYTGASMKLAVDGRLLSSALGALGKGDVELGFMKPPGLMLLKDSKTTYISGTDHV